MTYPDLPATDATEPLLAWRAGAVAHIRFNRPAALNAIDVPMAQGFLSAMRLVAEDRAVRVVVISGAGRAFMAGGDLHTLQANPVDGARALIGAIHPALEILAALPLPVLASAQGAVAGAGLGVMMGCDLAIGADTVKLGIAYPGVGASADCGSTWGLAHHVGLRQALQIALMGDTLDAAESLRLGLLNRVVPAADLAGATEALAQKLAGSATVALGQLKRLLRTAGGRDLHGHLEAESEAFLACAGTADFAEGVSAFLARRTPVFHGS